MVKLHTAKVLDVHHWNDKLFSFRTVRDAGLEFHSGHFLMLGLKIGKRPVMRAYSIVSAPAADHLEFLSVKVPDGPLTSHLQHIQPGDEVILGGKTTGTLMIDDLHPGKRLYLFATGTGLAPFMSIIRDARTYAAFEKIILCHGVRLVSDLAYRDYLENTLPQDPELGAKVRQQLIYYPTVTREPFAQQGRITTAIADGSLFAHLGMPPLDVATDRAMICGSTEMLDEVSAVLDARQFQISPRVNQPGDYVIERAFVRYKR